MGAPQFEADSLHFLTMVAMRKLSGAADLLVLRTTRHDASCFCKLPLDSNTTMGGVF
jgi:hypothetical protein